MGSAAQLHAARAPGRERILARRRWAARRGAAPAQDRRAAGPTGVGSLDALIALQEVGGPLERRRRAVRRAGAILDVLDEVKLALLEGGLPPAALERLMLAVRQERGEADEPRLRDLLDEIETRAVVELAKLEMARAAN